MNQSYQPTFIQSFAILLFVAVAMTACGGGGGGSGSNNGGTGGGGSAGPGPSKLFVGDAGNMAIISLSNANPSAGTLTGDRTIQGSNTSLSTSLRDLALDAANDRLYVANGQSVLVFDDVSEANGNVSPARVVTSIPVGTTGSLDCLYLDTANDVLYVGNNNSATTAEIQVFTNASSADGATPARTFTITSPYLTGMSVDVPRKILYAHLQNTAQPATSQVSVFDDADTASGNVVPTRVIAIGDGYVSGRPRGVVVDSMNNRLYVVTQFQLLVFDSASTKDGPISAGAGAPERRKTIPFPGSGNLALDVANDRLYTADGSNLNILHDASTATTGGAGVFVRLYAPTNGNLMAVAVNP